MGTPQFAVPTLAALAGSPWRPALVITQPDRPQGRRLQLAPPPVKEAALALGLPVAQPEDVNDPAFLLQLRALAPDVILTAAYGGYLRRELRRLPRLGCLNLHPSLLPRHRGPAPVPYTLFAGDEVTGMTYYRMTARMDAGPLLHQARVPVLPGECATALLERLALLGAEHCLPVLDALERGEATETPQNDTLATYTAKLGRADQLLRWEWDADAVCRRVRGLAEEPGALTVFRGQPLKIIACREVEGHAPAEPGAVMDVPKNVGVVVAAGQGHLLLQRVQPPGKRVMDAWAWHLGARIAVGERFCDAE